MIVFVPMFKGRKYEHIILKDENRCFSHEILPMIEIIQDHYQTTQFKTDPETGEYIKEQHGKRLQRVRCDPTDEDRDTLAYYRQLLNGKKAFVDLFRFSSARYGSGLDTSKLILSLKLNQNETLYLERLKEVAQSAPFIPVLSLKKDYLSSEEWVTDAIKQLQSLCPEIGVRLDEEAFERYLSKIATLLREKDYLMYDIGEQKVSSKEMELDEFHKKVTKASKIVLNSPRLRRITNGDFDNRAYTDLIDNSARDIKNEYSSIIGFGDYCGLKDMLPKNQAITKACALALFYDYRKNQFFAYVNSNRDESFRGYRELIPQIMGDALMLDPDNDCPAFKGIKQLMAVNKTGNWGNWNIFNASRYIDQMYRNR